MTPAQIVTEIEQAGGELWIEGDRLMFRYVPARLVPLIREQKAALLPLIASSPSGTTDATPACSLSQLCRHRDDRIAAPSANNPKSRNLPLQVRYRLDRMKKGT